MSISIYRTSDAWWAGTPDAVAKIDTTATTTAQLLADRAAIERAAASTEEGAAQTGEERRLIRGEEQCACGNLFGIANTAHRRTAPTYGVERTSTGGVQCAPRSMPANARCSCSAVANFGGVLGAVAEVAGERCIQFGDGYRRSWRNIDDFGCG
jgi:hypothetical protein